MSAGAFLFTKYEANYSPTVQIHPIRIQPETALASGAGGLVNSPPTAALTSPISATISKSRKSLGLHPRYLTISLTGAPPATYKDISTARITCLTQAFYVANALNSTVITYLGTTWRVSGFDAEKVK